MPPVHPPLYAARCGPARLTPACGAQRANCFQLWAHMNIHDVRDSQTSDAHHRLMPPALSSHRHNNIGLALRKLKLQEQVTKYIKKALRETQNLRAGCSKAAQLLDVAKRPIPQG